MISLLYLTGSAAPTIPVLQRAVPLPTQALISWLVRAIAYTPESYHIAFGLSNDALTLRSEVFSGSTNLTSTNLVYSANITNLHPFTQYYYRVIAANSFTTSQTAVEVFQTAEAGIICN